MTSSAVREPDFIRLFVERLEAIELPYMITGAVASVVYGEPRFTRDIDIVLELRQQEVPQFMRAFPEDEFYVPPQEVLGEEIEKARGHFNLIHHDTALRADIYLRGDDPLHGWAFARRRRIRVEESDVWLAPVEYVALRKLEYFRASGSDRHLRDVNMMLRISRDLVDSGELDRWIERLDLEEELEAARAYEA